MNRIEISVWGNGFPLLKTIKILINSGFLIKYIKVDSKNIETEIIEFLKSNKIPILYEYDPNFKVRFNFVVNYNKIITEEILSDSIFVNYHIGLLPKWRGNSANGWAIINGESHIGYTIHKVTPELDGGPIYYQFKTSYVEGQTYFDARILINKDYEEKISEILKNIYYDRMMNIDTDNQEYVYCSKFKPVDGVINWSETTDLILRRFYVFAPPLGTGLKFCFKGKCYEIKKISRANKFANSIGINGGIVYISKEGLWVKTKDTAVILEEIYYGGERINISEHFKIGQRL